MNRLQLRLLCLLLVSLLAASAFADKVVLNLSTMPGTDCGVEWIEGPCVLWFEAVTADDYQPVQPPQLVCFPFKPASTLILFPARLYVDLKGVEGIESIEVDIHEGAALEMRSGARLSRIEVPEFSDQPPQRLQTQADRHCQLLVEYPRSIRALQQGESVVELIALLILTEIRFAPILSFGNCGRHRRTTFSHRFRHVQGRHGGS